MRNVNPNPVNHDLAFVLYYAFKISAFLVSGVAIYLGYKLFILGVTGQASLSIEAKSIKGQLINAAPGLFFAVGGIAVAIATIWKGVQIDFDSDGRRFSRSNKG